MLNGTVNTDSPKTGAPIPDFTQSERDPAGNLVNDFIVNSQFAVFNLADIVKVSGPFDINELTSEKNIEAEQAANLNNALINIECLQARIKELQQIVDRKDISLDSLEDQLDETTAELSRIENQARDIQLQQEALADYSKSLEDLQSYITNNLLTEVLDLLSQDDDIFKQYSDDVSGYFNNTLIPLILSSVFPDAVQAATNSEQLFANIAGTFKYADTIATPDSNTIIAFDSNDYIVAEEAYKVATMLTDEEKKAYFLRNAFLNYVFLLGRTSETQYQALEPNKNSEKEGQSAKRGSLYEAQTLLFNKVLEGSPVPGIDPIETKRI